MRQETKNELIILAKNAIAERLGDFNTLADVPNLVKTELQDKAINDSSIQKTLGDIDKDPILSALDNLIKVLQAFKQYTR